jgi:sugar phosphate isomerase/epimerase
MNVGINSPMIEEFGGPISPSEIDLIELGIEKSGVLNGKIDYEMLDKLASLGKKFSIHAPAADAQNEDIRVDLGKRNRKNIEVMENVFEIGALLNAEYVVIHGGDADGDFRISFLNTISNLKELSRIADDYSITLLIENLFKERNHDRIGVLPHELAQIVESVAEENLKIVLDVGHAFITSIRYDFDLFLYFNILSDYIYHMHIHDNLGYNDQHLPLGHGKINFDPILKRIEEMNTKHLVLELKTKSRSDAKDSIEILNRLNGFDFVPFV